MNRLPDFKIGLREATDFVFASELCRKAVNAFFPISITNVIRDLLSSIDVLSKNCHIPEFTDHSLLHVVSVIDRASEWTVNNGMRLVDKLTARECSLLILSLICHDLGMLSQDPNDLPDGEVRHIVDVSTWVRRTHCQRLPKLLERLLLNFRTTSGGVVYKEFTDSVFFRVMCYIAMAHQEWSWQKTPSPENYRGIEEQADKVEKEYGGPMGKKRLFAIASIVAVCDLLDEDSARCDTETLLLHKQGTALNKAHWIRHLLTKNRVLVRNNRFNVQFRWPAFYIDPRGKKINEDPSGCNDGAARMIVLEAMKNHYSSALLYNDDLRRIDAGLDEPIFDPDSSSANLIDTIDIPWNIPALFEFWGSAPERFLQSMFEYVINPSKDVLDVWSRLNGSAAFRFVDLRSYHAFLEGRSTKTPQTEEEQTFHCIMNAPIKDDRTAFEVANEYLFYKSVQAHLNGNGFRAKFLASIAIEWPYGVKKSIVYLEDLTWAFSILLFWVTSEVDCSILRDCMRKFSLKEVGHEGLRVIEDSLLSIISVDKNADPLGTFEGFLNSSKNLLWSSVPKVLNYAVFDQSNWDCTLSILLQCAVEFMYYLEPFSTSGSVSKSLWNQLCQNWISKFSALNTTRMSLEEISRRLSIQVSSSYAKFSDQWSPNTPLELLWSYTFSLDTSNLIELLPKLLAKPSSDKESLAIIQKSISSVLSHTGVFKTPSGSRKNVPDWDASSVQRLQFGEAETVRSLFRKLSRQNLESKWSELDAQFSANKDIFATLRLISRLSFVLEIQGMRDWDIYDYLQSLKNQSKYSLWIGLNADSSLNDTRVSSFLISGVVKAFLSSGLSRDAHLKNQCQRAIWRLEVIHRRSESISDLLEAILHDSCNLCKYSGNVILSLVSDAIPDSKITEALKYSLDAEHVYNSFASGMDFCMLSWWSELIQWCRLSEEQWGIIAATMIKMCDDFDRNETLYRELFASFLIKSPLENAFMLFVAIAESTSRNRESYLVDFLRRDRRLLDQIPRLLESYPEVSIAASDILSRSVQKCREKEKTDVKPFVDVLRSILSRKQQTGEPSKEEEDLVDFALGTENLNIYEEDLNRMRSHIYDALKAEFVTTGEYFLILGIWVAMLKKTDERTRKIDDEKLLEFLLSSDQAEPKDIWQDLQDSQFSNVRFIGRKNNLVEEANLEALSTIVWQSDVKTAWKIIGRLDSMLHQMGNAVDRYAYIFLVLGSRFNRLSCLCIAQLEYLFGLSKNSEEITIELSTAIYRFLEDVSTKSIQLDNTEFALFVKKIARHLVDESLNMNDPNARRNAGLIIASCAKSRLSLENMGHLRAEVVRDTRARVRNTLEE